MCVQPLDELDYIVSQVSHADLTELLDGHTPASDFAAPGTRTEVLPRRFSAPKSDGEVQAARQSAVPKNTAKNTSWSVNVWRQWRTQRMQIRGSTLDCPPHLLICNVHELDYWLSRFVLEARRTDGQPYPPQTLYGLVCSLMRYVRELRPHINFYKDPEFAGFQKTMDGEMKRLRSLGLGVKRKQAEPISVKEENSLWDKGLLGCHSPKVLLHTMVYLCGLNFALRSGQEHRDLQYSQIEVVVPQEGPTYLIYTENVSKNNSGGLAQRKFEPKQVVHHSNTDNPDRCFIRLLQLYLEHCPTLGERKSSAFYLTPIRNPKSNIWYSTTPVGHNTLNQTVKLLCKEAGIPGYKTNHSLRVTNATRLFQSGMDEQLIMSRTGHRSVEGVRTYKRISDDQKQALSSVLNCATNGQPVQPSAEPGAKKLKLEVKAEQQVKAKQLPDTENMPVLHPVEASGYGLPPMQFSECSSITINIHH